MPKPGKYTGLGAVEIGRPPYSAVEPGRPCRGWAGAAQDRPCQMGSLWLLPEDNFCARHVPLEYLPVIVIRRNLWIKKAAGAFAAVLEATPLPVIPDDDDDEEL